MGKRNGFLNNFRSGKIRLGNLLRRRGKRPSSIASIGEKNNTYRIGKEDEIHSHLQHSLTHPFF